MTIETLIAAVPPPDHPFGFSGPWGPVEAELGTTLPQDYKDFVRIYGHGYFMQFLSVDIPRSTNGNTRLEKQVPLVCKIFAENDLGERPYPVWPEPGGLIPFGGTDNGDTLFWLQRGAPDEWPVVVWDRGLLGYELLECSLTGFLAGLATGEVLPKEFPDDLLPNECLFESFRPLVWVPKEFSASAKMRLSLGPPNPFRSPR